MSRSDFSGTNLSVDQVPYAVPPYTYQDSEMFTITVRTTPEALAMMVPKPLVPQAGNRLILYVGMLNVVEPVVITYGEAGIMIPVSFGERMGTYMPALYLDEIEMLTAGREVWGFPKFGGDIALKREGNRVEAYIKDGDVTLIGASMKFDGPGEKPPVYDREHFLLKSIPSVDGKGYDVRQINTCLVRNDTRKEVQVGRPELALASTIKNPLGDIPVEEILTSVYSVGDMILDKGELVYDYLAK
ncbi:MAG: acetoacetate decarboxylase family protein [bacterium]